MFVWSNIFWLIRVSEKGKLSENVSEECVTIAANAWLYLMQTAINSIVSPRLRKHQFIVSACKVLYVFFLFTFFFFNHVFQVNVNYMHTAWWFLWGSRWRHLFLFFLSNTTIAHLEQKNLVTQNPQVVWHYEHHVKAKVFLLFFQIKLCAFSIALNWHLFLFCFVEISAWLATTAICKYLHKYIYI